MTDESCPPDIDSYRIGYGLLYRWHMRDPGTGKLHRRKRTPDSFSRRWQAEVAYGSMNASRGWTELGARSRMYRAWRRTAEASKP